MFIDFDIRYRMALLRKLSLTLPTFYGQSFESIGSDEISHKNAKYDVAIFWYLPSNCIFVKVVFRDLDLDFQSNWNVNFSKSIRGSAQMQNFLKDLLS